MKPVRYFYINLALTLGYFVFFLMLSWGASGGDMVLIAYVAIAGLAHCLFIAAMRLLFKWHLAASFIGLIVGFLFFILVFKGIDIYKSQTPNRVIEMPIQK